VIVYFLAEPIKIGNEDQTVGSIAGGGRYDNLVGMFDSKNKQVIIFIVTLYLIKNLVCCCVLKIDSK
jgi:hypothetical protein